MPEKFQNERILISGMVVNQLDILEALKKATTSEEWAVSYGSAEKLRQDGNEKLANKDFSGILDIIGASLFQAGNGQHHSSSGKTMNEVLGVKDDLDQSVGDFFKTQSAK